MKTCNGFIDKKLVFVFVALVAFFLWLQYDNAPDRNGDVESTADAMVTTTTSGQIGENGAASNKTKPAQSNAKSAGSSVVQDAPANDKPTFKIVDLAPAMETGSNTAQSRPESDQPAYEIPLGDLAISGRVLTRSGAPVAGAQVTATASYIFEDGKRKAIPRGARQRMAMTLYDGTYSFDKLANGEYNVSTVATERYGRAWIQVRAGVDFADLIVATHQKIRLQGTVTSEEGEPLFGVKVRPNLAGASEVTSNREGRYGFDAMLPDNVTSVLVLANRDGYQHWDAQLAIGQSDDTNVVELNIVMEPDTDTDLADVSGIVEGPDREPVASQRVQLSSARLRQSYRSTTDINGAFVIRDVQPGEDYRVSINAADTYQDYFQKDIEVPEEGLTLNIELLDRDTGVLRGQMVNVFGNAVGDFSLVLQTKETSYYNQKVIGDRAGYFEVRKAPAGELLLKTKSNPYYSIEGIRLAPDAEQQVTVVLDWGYNEIWGQVVNEDGYPVAVPNISLRWAHEQYGIRTTARRTTASDERGNFRFTQLGPGNHRLTINAAGYKPVSLNHDVAMQGSDLFVELAAK